MRLHSAGTLVGFTLALLSAASLSAQEQATDPTLPETSVDRSMLPEDGDDDRSMTPEDADDTPGPNDQSNDPSQAPPAPVPTDGDVETRPPTTSPVPEPPLPPAPRRDQIAAAQQTGCWAKFYDGADRTGDSFTLVGPTEATSQNASFAGGWEGKISSIETGPAAIVTVYDDMSFTQELARLEPARTLSNIADDSAEFPISFRSIRVSCAATSG